MKKHEDMIDFRIAMTKDQFQRISRIEQDQYDGIYLGSYVSYGDLVMPLAYVNAKAGDPTRVPFIWIMIDPNEDWDELRPNTDFQPMTHCPEDQLFDIFGQEAMRRYLRYKV